MPDSRTRFVIAVAVLAFGCSRASDREYDLRGQILAVDQARQEVTIKHEDIPRFMPGMTMAFKVREKRLLEGRAPGDLVKATLVVRRADVYLRTLERTGFGPVPADIAVPTSAAMLGRGELVSDASFVDESGMRRQFANWRGSVVAVTFTYTRCPVPTFCPLLDRHFKAVQDIVRSDPNLNGQVRLLSVSFDPDHDTPGVLSKHAERVGADRRIWSFVTGPSRDVSAFAAQFGVSILQGGSAQAEIVHNLRTAIIGADGRLRTVLNGGEWTPAELLTELRNARAGR